MLGAKGQAIMKQSPARLIIYADQSEASDKNKYLRFFGIITQDPKILRSGLRVLKALIYRKGFILCLG